MAKRETIIEIRIDNQDALNRLGKQQAELLKVRESIKLLNSIIRENGEANNNQARQLGELNVKQETLRKSTATLAKDLAKYNIETAETGRAAKVSALETLKQTGALTNLDASLAKNVGQLGKWKAEQFLVQKATADLKKEIQANGVETEAQADDLGKLATKAKFLSSNLNELTNDTAGLTAAGTRFRDKMASATLEALKQSGVIGQLDARTVALTADIDKLNAQFEAGTVDTAQYTANLDKLTKELDQTKAATAASEARFNALEQEFRQGKISADQFRASVDLLNKEVKTQGSLFAKGVNDLKGYALGAIGVVAAVQLVQRVIGNAVDTIVEFDKAINKISTISPEFAASTERISEAARSVGIEFGFAAAETAGAIDELGRAGLSVEQILNGGLQTALSLAVAGQLSLSEAAEATATGLNQFSLAAEDSARVADSLVNGANAAQGGVGQLREALNQSALAASGLGLSIEETVGALTTFAKAGLLGSDAGTSFRTMLIRLQNPTDESTKLLEQYNIQAFDLEGNFVGIADLAGQLQEKLSGLTQEQRAQALAQIFGSDALRAANVLYEQGEAGVNLYTEAVAKSGTALEQAGKLQESQSARFAKLSATYKSAILALEEGSGIAAKSIGAATETLTKFAEAIIEASGESDKFKGKLASYTELLGFFSIATGLGTSAVRALIDQVTGFDEKLKTAGKGAPAAFDPLKASLKELGAELKLAQDRQAAFLKNGKESGAAVAAEFQPRIDALQRIIAARSKEAEILNAGKPSRDQAIKDAKQEGLTLSELQAELKRLNDERALLRESDKNRLKENAAAITGIEARIKAISGEGKASEESAKAAKIAAGSLADLNAQIAKLKALQEQKAVTPTQFQEYSKQIEVLQDQVNTLTSSIGNIAFDPLTPPDTVGLKSSTQEGPLNLDATNAQAAADQLIAIQEQETADLERLREDARVRDIEGIVDLNAEKLLLQKEFEAGSEMSQAEYNANVAALDEALAQQKRNAIASVGDALTAFSALAKKGSAEQKALATAAALVNTYLGVSQVLANPTVIPEPFGTINKIASIATVLATGLAAVRQIQSVQGFAEGGIIQEKHGKPIRRSNGDNRVITAKVDEMILTEEQQREIKRRAGFDIFRLAGVPGANGSNGFIAGGVVDSGSIYNAAARGTALVNLGAAPSPGLLDTLQTNAISRAADPNIFVRVTDIDNVQGQRARVLDRATL